MMTANNAYTNAITEQTTANKISYISDLIENSNSEVSSNAANAPVARWLCNVSESVKLSKNVENGLNISGRGKYSQYELMVKLLKAETCDVIYFDCQLSASQIGILKMLQVFSNTELVHSRLAMQFDRAMG